MVEDTRRTIDELIARYQLEPALRDVYVEGPSDKALLDYVLGLSGGAVLAVYEISTIDVPADVVSAHHLEANNRGRLIALAIGLADALPEGSCCVACVVDADFDRLLAVRHESNVLFMTDYACAEMYAFNEDALSTFFRVVVRRLPPEIGQAIDDLAEVLQEIFLIRLVNHAQRLALRHTSWERCCKVVSGRLRFDPRDYLTRHLNANATALRVADFELALAPYRAALTPDFRNQVNGHDFIQLLCFYVRRVLRSRVGCDPVYVERVLHLCINREHTQQEPLFAALSARLH